MAAPVSHFKSIFGSPPSLDERVAMNGTTAMEADQNADTTTDQAAIKQKPNQGDEVSSLSAGPELTQHGNAVDVSRLKGAEPPLIPTSAATPPIQNNYQPPKPFTFLTSSLITLYIGGPKSPSRTYPAAVPFYVHSELLTRTSTFFRGALASKHQGMGFAESRRGVIHLPEERVEDWIYFCQWLYGKAVAGMLVPAVGQGDSVEYADADGHEHEDRNPEIVAAHHSTAAAWVGNDQLHDLRQRQSQSQSTNLLHHQLIDPPLAKYRHWLDEKKGMGRLDPWTGAAITQSQLDQGRAHSRPGPGLESQNLQQQQSTHHTRDHSSSPFGTLHAAPDADTQQEQYPQRERPPPPAFGPLIRLYILADRYDVAGGLREEVMRRVEEVAFARTSGYDKDNTGEEGGVSIKPMRISRCSRRPMQPHLNTKRQASTSRSRHPHFVPDKLDVNRLWRGVVTEPLDREVERVKGSSRDAATPPGLKRLIIDLYAGMKGRGVFAACPRPALSSSPIPDLVGMQQTNNPTTTHAPQAEDEDYDSSFLRDLVVRLLDAR